MKKKFISVATFCAVALSTSVWVGCSDYDDDIQNLQGQITANATSLDAQVNEKVAALNQAIESLGAQDASLATALETAKADLQQAVTDARSYADIQAEAARVAAIEAAQAQVATAREELQAAINAANEEISKVNSTVAGQQETIASLLAADVAMQESINSANAAIAEARQLAEANKADLAQVAENLKTLETTLGGQISTLQTGLDGALTQIAQNKAEVETNLEKVNSMLASNAEAIKALEGKDAELLAKITENSNELAALGEKLVAAEALIAANAEAAKAYTDAQVALIKNSLGLADDTQIDLPAAIARLAAAEQAIAGIQESIAALTEEDEELAGLIEATKGTLDALAAEVAQISDQVTNNSSAIRGLGQEVLGNTNNIEALQELYNQLSAVVESNKSESEEALNDAVEKIMTKFGEYATTEQLNTINNSLTQSYNSLQQKYEALVTQIGAIQGDQSVVGLIDEKITDVKNDVSDLNRTMTIALNLVNNDITNLQGTIKEFNRVVEAQISGASNQLRSLVFSPENYFQGIECIPVWSYDYNPYYVDAADLTKDQSKEMPRQDRMTSIKTVPEVEASYYINPSNAKVDTADVSKFSFIANTANILTRDVKGNQLKVNKVDLDNKEGKIKVNFSMTDGNEINSGATGGKVDVVALRYNYVYVGEDKEEVDTLITSDFAALKLYSITNFAINKAAQGKTEEWNEFHLATTAQGAFASDAPFLTIDYNDTKGINLNEWFNVHYYVNNANNESLWGGQQTVNKKNFKLVYELIGYKASDTDNTNESQHASINNDSILNVHEVGGTNTSDDNRKIIGRKPLLRVKLVDGSNNQIAAVGYILVKIEDVYAGNVSAESDADDVITTPYTVVCDDETILDNVIAMTWLSVENKILGQVNMSKDEFEATYTTEKIGRSEVLKQYTKVGDNFVPAELGYGTVLQSAPDDQSHETKVLLWTVGNQTAYNEFVTNKKTSISTWVKFVPINNYGKEIYVQLTWTPSSIATNNGMPVATIKNDDKKAADWHAKNSRNAGFDELHIQPGEATVQTVCKYEHMVVEDRFNTTPLAVIKRDIAGTYPALANAASISYRFAANQEIKSYVGQSGTNYSINVSNDGSTIYANWTELATIDPANGDITLAKNDVSKDVINNKSYTSRDQISKALTFKVVIENKTCEPATDLIAWGNHSNELGVKVIRPMFVNNGSIKPMTLNNNSTLTQSIRATFTDFNGYNPQTFRSASGNLKSFFDFYGPVKVELDTRTYASGIASNYTGTMQNVDGKDFTVTPTFNQTISGDGATTTVGSIKLTQGANMSRANDFNVTVYMKVSYNWGTIYTSATFKVNKAQ